MRNLVTAGLVAVSLAAGLAAWRYFQTQPRKGTVENRVRLPGGDTATIFPSVTRPSDAPVILFFPAWSGIAEDNTYLCEHLAKAGFHVILLSSDAPSMDPDFSTAGSYASFVSYAEVELEKRVTAAGEAVAWIRSRPPELNGSTGKIGAAGFSFGGAVAAELCRRNSDVIAGANLDGTLFGEAARQGAPKPFLFITNTEERPSVEALEKRDTSRWRQADFTDRSFADMERWLATHGGWLLKIDGAAHEHFSDRGLRSFRNRRFARGVLEKTATVLTEFFSGALIEGNPGDRMQAAGVTHFPTP